ncbi:MAG: L,D-transpeptidase family protein [Bradyrhizobium sp.]
MAQAEAAVFWSDDDAGYSRPAPAAPQHVQRTRRRASKQLETSAKEAAKPQGPLIISISISRQNLRVYDANGFFAETPISTGMAGHLTPMGAFSVIQKQKLHHSNIYSGAPMPFMQRITWSGIAMHAGVLPGYPASHGCIRMPMAFAVKMYGWTRMGARVVVTPGEMTPASFSHPLLATQKVVPQPVAMDAPKTDAKIDVRADVTAKGDKAAAADPSSKPETSVASLDLRSSVGHDSHMQTVMNAPAAPKPLSEQTHTADATSSSQLKAPVTMSDAAPSASQTTGNAALSDSASPAGEHPTADQATDTPPEPKSGAVKSVAELLAADSSEMAPSETKPVEAKPTEAAAPDMKAAETAAADRTDTKNDQAPANLDVAKTEAKLDDVKAQAPPAEIAKAEPKPAEKANGGKPDESVTATSNPPAADVKKDQARPSDSDKVAPAKPALAMAKGTGPISVFVSRKDSKLYVRQNFAPLFEVPVSIAPSDRPLGTHIFTAEADKNDSNILRWSVVTLPNRNAERRDDDERASRHRRIAGAAEIAKPVPAPDSPAEALDRLTIPAEAMARINDAISTGGSIIVSDQGIAAGETGEGTDFIVSLR